MIQSNSIRNTFAYDICENTGRISLIYYSNGLRVGTINCTTSDHFKYIADLDIDKIDSLITKIIAMRTSLVLLTKSGTVYICKNTSFIQKITLDIAIRDIFYHSYTDGLYMLDHNGHLWKKYGSNRELIKFDYDSVFISDIIPSLNIILDTSGQVYYYDLINSLSEAVDVKPCQSIKRCADTKTTLILSTDGELFCLRDKIVKPFIHHASIKFYCSDGFCILIYDKFNILYLQYDNEKHVQHCQHDGEVVDIICNSYWIVITTTKLYFYEIRRRIVKFLELRHCVDNCNVITSNTKSARKI